MHATDFWATDTRKVRGKGEVLQRADEVGLVCRPGMRYGFWYVLCLHLLGCNNGIGGFQSNPCNFSGTKVARFFVSLKDAPQKMQGPVT